jgi:hypothetical protein
VKPKPSRALQPRSPGVSLEESEDARSSDGTLKLYRRPRPALLPASASSFKAASAGGSKKGVTNASSRVSSLPVPSLSSRSSRNRISTNDDDSPTGLLVPPSGSTRSHALDDQENLVSLSLFDASTPRHPSIEMGGRNQLAKTPLRSRTGVPPPPSFLPSRSDLSYSSPPIRPKKSSRGGSNNRPPTASRKKRLAAQAQAQQQDGGDSRPPSAAGLRSTSASHGLEELLRSSLPPSASSQWGLLLNDERETRAMDAELALVPITPAGTANSRSGAGLMKSSIKRRPSSRTRTRSTTAASRKKRGPSLHQGRPNSQAGGEEVVDSFFDEGGDSFRSANDDGFLQHELDENRRRLASLSAELEKEKEAAKSLRVEMEKRQRQKEAELETAIEEAEAQTRAREEAEAFARSKVEEAEAAERAREEEARARRVEGEARERVERELREQKENEKRNRQERELLREQKEREEKRRRDEEREREKKRKEDEAATRSRGNNGDDPWGEVAEAVKRERRELWGDMESLAAVLGSLDMFDQAIRCSLPPPAAELVATV